MPIHLRADPGDYAAAVLCPGDPRRAAYIAATFFDPGWRQVNEERGMRGFTGTFDGRPGRGLRLADTVIAMSATCEDETPLRYADVTGFAATATFGLVERAAQLVRDAGTTVHVGPVVTSGIFYDPDLTNVPRWERLGHLGLEMEAGMLYAVAAVKGVEALAIMTVSDILGANEDERQRINDEQLRQGVDDMI